jgi:phosphocarrier protein HPr
VQTSSDAGTAAVEVSLPADVDLHARPAATFVRAAMGFSSEIWVAVDEREADAKSLLSILALGARRGTSLRLRAEGDDAVAAIDALSRTLSGLRE